MLRIIVLGAAAGGGFPQWNCNCANCRRARSGDAAALPQTQSSIAVTADDRHWFLLNASPDLRQQLAGTPCLQPQYGLRSSPVVGAVLTNADVDHVAGLLTLREAQPLAVYATGRVQSVLRANPIFNVLDPDKVARRTMDLDRPEPLLTRGGGVTGLTIEAFAVPGKIALWLEDPTAADFGSTAGDTVGLRVSDGTTSVFYIPGCAALPPALAERLRNAALVLFDGTTWSDDEMQCLGLGDKTASRMGHMAMSGPDGTIAAFDSLNVRRRVFIHINNSNPVLLADSPQRRAAAVAGWEVAQDGMEIRL